MSAFGVNNLGITPNGTIGIIVNLAVAAWGIYAGMKKKATVTA